MKDVDPESVPEIKTAITDKAAQGGGGHQHFTLIYLLILDKYSSTSF